jgi:hypothetical protein
VIEDDRLAHALLHEANLRLETIVDPSERDNEVRRLGPSLQLAKLLMTGTAAEQDKDRARRGLNPATLQLFEISKPGS